MLELKTNKSKDLRQRSFDLSVDLIRFINKVPKNDCNRVITNQLIRCGTSIGANIFEAKASSSKKDFINYYHIALKSGNESRYWLDLLKTAIGLNFTELDLIASEVEEICKMLSASLITLKNK